MKDALMHPDLINIITRYRELYAQVDPDESHREDLADLVRAGEYLIELMAREIVALCREVRRGDV